MAMSRSRGARSLTRSPPMIRSPSVMSSSPAIIRSAVDFPQPEGPTGIMNSPSPMSRSIAFTASKPSGYRLVISLNWISWWPSSSPSRAPGDRRPARVPVPAAGARPSSRTSWRSCGSKTAAKPAPPVVGASTVAHLDLAFDDDQVRAFVDLVLLERLAGRQVDGNRSRLSALRVQDPRLTRLDLRAPQVPVLHGRDRTRTGPVLVRQRCLRPLRPPRAAAPRPGGSGARRASARRPRAARSPTA